MTFVLDSGALIALERGDRALTARIAGEHRAGRSVRTHGGVVGQVWRGGTTRQAQLARLLTSMDIVPLDAELGKQSGMVLAKSRTSDVIDAALVVIARDGDCIFTSDVGDIELLAVAADVDIDIVRV